MSEMELPSAEQQSYWREMQELKKDAFYVRDYRNATSKIVTATAVVRALTSSASIAAWAIWRNYAYLWAVFIAGSQVADALGPVLPFRKRHQALSRWANSLNRTFVLAQRDWDDISFGTVSDAKIRKLTHQIRAKRQRYEARFAPSGLPLRPEVFNRAERDTVEFFRTRYPQLERGLENEE